jgi:hypothetical protein
MVEQGEEGEGGEKRGGVEGGGGRNDGKKIIGEMTEN